MEAPDIRPGLLGLHREAELLDAVPDLIAVDAEELPRLRLIAARPLERLHEQLTFDLVEADALGGQLELGRRDRARQRGELAGLQPFMLDEQHRALDGVA